MKEIVAAVLVLVALALLVTVASANICWVRPLITATRTSPGELDLNFVVPQVNGVFDCELFVADGDKVLAVESSNSQPAHAEYWPCHLYELGFRKISEMTVPGGSSGNFHYRSKWDGPGPHIVTVAIAIRLREASANPNEERVIWIPAVKAVTIP